MAIKKNVLTGLVPASQLRDKRTSIYKLIHNIRKEPVKSLKPPTEAQQKQRLKFKLMGLFIGHLRELTKISYLFKKNNKGLTAGNIIGKQILTNGIIGEYPDFKINYSVVELSRGGLIRVEDPHLMVKTKGKIRVSWESYNGDSNDTVTVFIYNETKNKEFCLMNVAKRDDLRVDLQLDKFSKKDILHGWVFLADEGKRQVSDSVYVSNLKD